MTLQTERLHTVEQIRGFLDGNGEMDFGPLHRDEAYDFVRRTLARLDYDALGRAGKGTETALRAFEVAHHHGKSEHANRDVGGTAERPLAVAERRSLG